MIGALKHVRKKLPISFPVTDSADLKIINLLISSNSAKSKIIYDGEVNEEIIERLLAVDKLSYRIIEVGKVVDISLLKVT